MVFNLRDSRFHWFDLAADIELPPAADGVIRVGVFPGLWIDTAGAMAGNLRRMHAVLDVGLATPEHAAFVAALAARKTTT